MLCTVPLQELRGEKNTAIVRFLINDEHANHKSPASNEFGLLYLTIKAASIDLVRYIIQKIPVLVSKKTCSVCFSRVWSG
jgi:hypothetical protein